MTFDPSDYSERVLALAQFLEVEPDEVDECRYDEQLIEYCGDHYLVLTDGEADRHARDAAKRLLQEELDQVPDHLQMYFDDELYISDTVGEGRGSLLDTWNGSEEEVEVDGTTYYIYRR